MAWISPNSPLVDHLAGLPHQRVARVVVGQGEHDFGLINDLGQLFGLRQVKCHRFVAHHVEARFDSCLGDFKVRMVGGGHADKIDSLALG